MRVERVVKFAPVTIVIETQEELDYIISLSNLNDPTLSDAFIKQYGDNKKYDPIIAQGLFKAIRKFREI